MITKTYAFKSGFEYIGGSSIITNYSNLYSLGIRYTYIDRSMFGLAYSIELIEANSKSENRLQLTPITLRGLYTTSLLKSVSPYIFTDISSGLKYPLSIGYGIGLGMQIKLNSNTYFLTESSILYTDNSDFKNPILIKFGFGVNLFNSYFIKSFKDRYKLN